MSELPNNNPTTDPIRRTFHLGVIILVLTGVFVLALIAALIWVGGYW
jgi:hypothetical protein